MIVFWGDNIAGKTRGQAFMIKGQPFLNGYVSARLVVIVGVIETITFNSYITTTESFASNIEATHDFDSNIETTLTFKSEVK